MKHYLILLGGILLLSACDIRDPYDKVSYYDVEVEGVVVYADTNEPVEFGKVTVITFLQTHEGIFGLTGDNTFNEYYTTNRHGHFFIKFVKHTKQEDAHDYSIYVSKEGYVSYYTNPIYSNEIKSANGKILLDTIKIEKIN
ncbi:MAG: hypothetical protein JXQ69_00655 [Paludibacteraceae bacterium]|nr:hypothetical protein [Paludibacteraceae bacterium]MBN2786807.1 hypothetical protein [Paludibacteraceae bacterium]